MSAQLPPRPTDVELLFALDVALEVLGVLEDLVEHQDVELGTEEARRMRTGQNLLPDLRKAFGKHLAHGTLKELNKLEVETLEADGKSMPARLLEGSW